MFTSFIELSIPRVYHGRIRVSMNKNVFFNEQYLYGALAITTLLTIIGSLWSQELHPVLVYLLSINAVTFVMYGIDKRYAQLENHARIPEKHLLILGFLGGTGGALLAMKYIRHKSKKSSYQVKVSIVFFLQLILAYIALQL